MLYFLISFYPVNASVMESKNYRLESDEINMGALGEMRNFSSSLVKNYNLKEMPVVFFTSQMPSFKIVSAGVLILTILIFVFYVYRKKGLFSKK